MPSRTPTLSESRYWEHKFLTLLVREKYSPGQLFDAHKNRWTCNFDCHMGVTVKLIPAAGPFFRVQVIDQAAPGVTTFHLHIAEITL